MRSLALLLAVVLALAHFVAVATRAFADAARVSYKPPVDGPIVDTWRPPDQPWTAGNRGIDYAPGPGTPVKAAADGEVTFAGQVGGELHVVVLHPDGVRTSYSFLQSVSVHRGDRVRQGQVVGTSGDRLHFGARVGDDYIDPRTLFDDGPPHVYLVPDEVKRPGTEAEERSGLNHFLGGLSSAGRAAGGFIAGAAGAAGRAVGAKVASQVDMYLGMMHYATQFHPTVHVINLARTTADWWSQRRNCTPASVAPPPVPERRIAVLVAGLGSNSDKDAIDDVNATGLGYVDWLRFSYNGGDTTRTKYGPHDTTIDLRTQARRLRDFLREVRRKHPGTPVDLIAHSQGGIIARTALAYEYDPKDPRLPRVANLITLASPHRGADLATGLTMLGHTDIGGDIEKIMDKTKLTPFDPAGTSVTQLSETSRFIADLHSRQLPEGISFTSIGSRGDFTVPGGHTRAPGARNAVVSLAGLTSDHSSLPGSAAGRREVALAAAGMAPTCQSLGNMVADTFVSDAIATGEDVLASAAFYGAQWVDKRNPCSLAGC